MWRVSPLPATFNEDDDDYDYDLEDDDDLNDYDNDDDNDDNDAVTSSPSFFHSLVREEASAEWTETLKKKKVKTKIKRKPPGIEE